MCGILAISPTEEAGDYRNPDVIHSMLGLGFTGLARSTNRGKDGGCGAIVYAPDEEYKLSLPQRLRDRPEVLQRRFMQAYEGLSPLNRPPYKAMLGHVRYATSGDVNDQNVQPLLAHWPYTEGIDEELEKGPHGVVLTMIVNGETWVQPEWERKLGILQKKPTVDIKGATSDSAKIAGLLLFDYAMNPDMKQVLHRFYDTIFDFGMISAVGILVDDRVDKRYMFTIADGGRPMVESYVDGFRLITSETSYPHTLKNKHKVTGMRPINQGLITIQDLVTDEIETIRMDRTKRMDFFEVVYFQDHLSHNFGVSNAIIRRRLGAALAREHPVEFSPDTIVAPVPNSGNYYAEGFAEELGLKRRELICRSILKEGVRTYIASMSKHVRFNEAELKFEMNEADCSGKKVVVVDDSVVRGTNTAIIVRKLWDAGAEEIHVRVGCPPIIGPSHSGVNMRMDENLVTQLNLDPQKIVIDHSVLEKMLEDFKHPDLGRVETTSFGYLSLEALKDICGLNFVYGYVDGKYEHRFPGQEENGFRFVPVVARAAA